MGAAGTFVGVTSRLSPTEPPPARPQACCAATRASRWPARRGARSSSAAAPDTASARRWSPTERLVSGWPGSGRGGGGPGPPAWHGALLLLSPQSPGP